MKMLIAVAFAVSGGIASYMAPSPATAPVSANIDRMQTAAINTNLAASSGARSYSISNIAKNSVCIVNRGKITTPRTHDIKAGVDCDDVWPHLSEARNWTENSDGTVVVSDASGNEVLQLIPGDGAAYVSADTQATPLTVSLIR